ncbi:hypothetical protein EVAR_52994_1 [Eumeta japonica]|uniref:PiggyBac transposable element-derived protein domain-containing protein n=1 Tax=Eumeta variegata TaxID=151549 RepID=A0A4C1YN69_EUMVA|nr:hypothetical protein EVAR_52994_1 [Eumeta japonica]
MFRRGRDQRLLTQDDDQGIIDVEIEDTTLRQNKTPDSLPGPSTSTAEPEIEAQVTHQPAFKWSQRTYLPNIFRNVEYEFGKVKICQVEADTLLTPFDIFCAATNFDDLVHYIVSESVRYAHQNGREFTIEPEEMKAFFGMNLVMGYHVLPSLRDYWSTEPDMGYRSYQMLCHGLDLKKFVGTFISVTTTKILRRVELFEQTENIFKSAPIDRSMKRGDIYTASFHGISYVKWMDNKAVHLLTNFLSPIEIDTVKRRKAGSADKIDVRCPRIVSHYNKIWVELISWINEKDKDRSGRPKMCEDAELEEDSSQTQKQLALTPEVTQQAVSHRLKSL